MIVNSRDVLRKIHENMNANIEYRLFSENAEAGLRPSELAPLHGYIEKGTLMASLKENKAMRVDIRSLFAEIWNSFAYFEFDGQRVCECKAFGKPMLALNENFFKQGAYSEFVEETLLASKGSREVVVEDISEDLAHSMMKEFNAWRQSGEE
ncbi:MAG TPA: hypothetical protein DCZ00_04125 [Lactococcus sp.]|uniref:hypothetical protein n=1 Tax=unclassified Lactococcus TaxID=2643510 RepID=UPI000E8D537B|nr:MULTISPECIES: hypothetical protein [unclassified Lactococcus]HBC90615.1 hypothetical protein [Lactococcus sp.]